MKPVIIIVSIVATALATFAVAATAIFALVIASLNMHGDLQTFGAGEVYVTDNADRDEGTRLGEYLLQTGYFDDTETRSVQLDSIKGQRVVRFVTQEIAWNEENYLMVFGKMAADLSRDVFGGQEIRVELCDEWLKTQTVATQLEIMQFGAGELLRLDTVDRETAETLGEFLTESGWFDEAEARTVAIDRQGETHSVTLCVLPIVWEADSLDAHFTTLKEEIEEAVFDGQPIRLNFCDDMFEIRKTLGEEL